MYAAKRVWRVSVARRATPTDWDQVPVSMDHRYFAGVVLVPCRRHVAAHHLTTSRTGQSCFATRHEPCADERLPGSGKRVSQISIA